MDVPADLPVVDHHCHLSPHGEGVQAARRFRSAGGTHLFLCTQSYTPTPPLTLDAYRAQFETTLDLAERVRREARLVVHPVLAPFPVDLIAQIDSIGRTSAVALHRQALDLCGGWVRERRAVALGEVGWPHFPLPPETAAAAFDVFDHALSLARDLDCPVVVHSPDLDADGYGELGRRARRQGLAAHRVVKHYARTSVPAVDRGGIAASYVATQDLVHAALPQVAPWFLETDFLDDPRRPGAVLDLATVPRRARSIAQRDPGALDRLRIPFVDSIRAVYGFEPTVEEVPTG